MQFNKELAKFIPSKISENKTPQEKKAICQILDKADSQDPNRIYCYAVKRNPVGQDGKPIKRSIFNDNKTRLLRAKLYEKLGEDHNISFMYSLDDKDEKCDEDIIAKWTENKKL